MMQRPKPPSENDFRGQLDDARVGCSGYGLEIGLPNQLTAGHRKLSSPDGGRTRQIEAIESIERFSNKLQFRALVQSDVAARVEKLNMEQLLPGKLLRRHAFIAAGIGTACIVAFALTGFQFGTLMMRALLPMANFARVSKVQVTIVEPSPAEMRVPQGDTLPLTIELSGQGAQTHVSLSQDNNANDEAREHSEKNWKTMLDGLKKLLEK